MLQSFLTVGQQILTLYLLLVVGFVLGKVKLLDDRASVALSSLVMYVVSPCMMVVAFQRPLEHTALHNFGVVTGVSAVLHVVFIAAAMLLIRDRDRERQNCLRFAAVFSNCGFMGYPLMAALLGSIGVFYGSAYVIVFTILSWTWGVYVITGDRSQLRVFSQPRIPVGGQHLAVGVHVDTSACRLLQQLVQVLQIVAGYHDERPPTDVRVDLCGRRVTEGGGVGLVQQGHALIVYQTKFRDEGQPLLNGVLLPQGAQPLVEPLADRLILLPKAESVMGIGCHTLHAEQQCGAQRHDVRIAAP